MYSKGGISSRLPSFSSVLTIWLKSMLLGVTSNNVVPSTSSLDSIDFLESSDFRFFWKWTRASLITKWPVVPDLSALPSSGFTSSRNRSWNILPFMVALKYYQILNSLNICINKQIWCMYYMFTSSQNQTQNLVVLNRRFCDNGAKHGLRSNNFPNWLNLAIWVKL